VTGVKRLAQQTAIYGVPSILGRILGYLLVPMYTRVFMAEAYGVVNLFYSFASFLKVILTYGMETAFFRFNEHEADKNKVYSTGMISLVISSVIFLTGISIFARPIAAWLQYPDHPNYVTWFAWILALDAMAAIPFARLRSENRAKRFAGINMANICINIGLNLFFILLCPAWLNHHPQGALSHVIRLVYRPDWGIEYIFISNLVASVVTLVLLLPQFITVKWKTDPELWKRMFFYAFPLLFAGMAGIINETFDRIMLRYLLPLPDAAATHEVGIYAACYKISILMTIFIQAYRYAAEPFFFSKAKDKDSKQTYARIMDYFVIAVSLIFLTTMVYLDDFILPLMLGKKEYLEGRAVIPVLMMANLCLGVYYNLSIWYKLTGQTHWGAWLSVFGAVITLVLNFWWIPLSPEHRLHSYYGSAWATFICYGFMMVLSYLIGKKRFPVKYNLVKFFTYLGLAFLLYVVSTLVKLHSYIPSLAFHTALILIFIGLVFLIERPALTRQSLRL
jgi:O-antigen/teichoic acid export membrane protein